MADLGKAGTDIPSFTPSGHLPDGLHDACFEEVIERFVTNPTRKALCHRLERFLLKVIDSGNFSFAYIDGDFVTARELPREIHLILQAREKFGVHAFRAMEEFLELGLDSIEKDYSIRLRFWFDGTPKEFATFCDYFQHLSPEKAHALVLPRELKHGIVRIKL